MTHHLVTHNVTDRRQRRQTNATL